MRINEENIDHNVSRMIDDYVAFPFEYSEQNDDADHMRLVTLGYIRGVLDFAKTMKEVLKA